MSRAALIEAHGLVEELNRRLARRKITTYYPDNGPLRRELYAKHQEFFAAGSTHRQRLMLAANRIGKTEGVGLYELVMHCTGDYPAWWKGRRFDRPVTAWAAGDTRGTVRDILQKKLLGPLNAFGTGLVPGDTIVRLSRAPGVADTIEILYIKHKSGGSSVLTLKSYDQRRQAFQGTEVDVILLDEEPPMDIYTECLIRTMTNNGLILLTFTPLLGVSEVVLSFVPGGSYEAIAPDASRYVVMAGWDDVPHLSAEAKAELLESIPPFQRDARSKGIPQLGAGAIYPVPETDITVEDFAIPDHWPRAYGLDVGWQRTAAVWGALNPDTNVWYLYSEHYRGQAEPIIHAQAIKARGDWIYGAIDPAAHARTQKDGDQLFDLYTEQDLHLINADNGVESGLLSTWLLLSTGRLKVFKSLGNWFKEYRLYRRDDKGKVVKSNDHLMDATRYFVVTGRNHATTNPADVTDDAEPSFGAAGWMS